MMEFMRQTTIVYSSPKIPYIGKSYLAGEPTRMPFGPSTTLADYYRGIEDCLEDDNENFSLITLELLQDYDRLNQTNSSRIHLIQSTITEPVLRIWFTTNRPNDHQLKETLLGKVEEHGAGCMARRS